VNFELLLMWLLGVFVGSFCYRVWRNNRRDRPTPLDVRFVGELSKLTVEPGDVFVFHDQRYMSVETHDKLQKWWRDRMPNHQLLVIDGGSKLSVMQPLSNQREGGA
jgi:hypothetical protein